MAPNVAAIMIKKASLVVQILFIFFLTSSLLRFFGVGQSERNSD